MGKKGKNVGENVEENVEKGFKKKKVIKFKQLLIWLGLNVGLG
jgi:hypothetical protein